jgi:hypothetical protein
MITLHLSLEDAQLLRNQMALRADHIERELVRTDAPAMQHAIARDLERVQALVVMLDQQIASGGDLSTRSPAARPPM